MFSSVWNYLSMSVSLLSAEPEEPAKEVEKLNQVEPKDSKCPCCCNYRWISPYSGVWMKAHTYIDYPFCFQSVAIRCPLCFSREIAEEDKEFMIQYYFDEKNPVILKRYNDIRAAIKEKYPDWNEDDDNMPDMPDKEEIPVVQPGEHCDLCDDTKLVCPGCTGSQIPSRLFMGCGVNIRCPWCVDYKGAMMDKQIFLKYYHQTNHPIFKAQQGEVIRGIREKFPDWVPEGRLPKMTEEEFQTILSNL